jgi:hypothetical protein
MDTGVIPDPVEIRDQIQLLRDDIARCRAIIANAKHRIAELSRHDYAETPPPPDRRPMDSRGESLRTDQTPAWERTNK